MKSTADRRRKTNKMFGYLRLCKDEIRIKDMKKYSSYYCALCNEIKKDYGVFWTLFLNYESTYILLFLESCLKCDTEEKILKCHMNPFQKKKIEVNSENLKYTAFINMYLLALKFEDDRMDDKNLLYAILQKRLSRKQIYKEMMNIHEELIELLREQSAILQRLEKEKGCIDSCADTTGMMLRHIVSYWQERKNCETECNSYKLQYYIGKLIYILDAYEDFEKDSRKKQFNPILYMEGEEKENLAKTETIIMLLKNSIRKEMKKIEFVKNTDIIENILTYGISNAIQKIKEKKIKCIKNTH